MATYQSYKLSGSSHRTCLNQHDRIQNILLAGRITSAPPRNSKLSHSEAAAQLVESLYAVLGSHVNIDYSLLKLYWDKSHANSECSCAYPMENKKTDWSCGIVV